MKIKVEVDLSDFYSENDSETSNSFNEEIKNHIAWQVKTMVWDDFKKIALDQLKNEISTTFSETYKLEVENLVKNLLVTKQVKKDSRSNVMMTIPEYVEERFNNDFLSPSRTASDLTSSEIRKHTDALTKDIKQTAIDISKQLKEQYDMMFASQIFTKMREQGLLKEDVVKLLLDKPEQNG